MNQKIFSVLFRQLTFMSGDWLPSNLHRADPERKNPFGASGWWIIPAMLLGLAIWIAIVLLILAIAGAV